MKVLDGKVHANSEAVAKNSSYCVVRSDRTGPNVVVVHLNPPLAIGVSLNVFLVCGFGNPPRMTNHRAVYKD